jgi:hypothetical protein
VDPDKIYPFQKGASYSRNDLRKIYGKEGQGGVWDTGYVIEGEELLAFLNIDAAGKTGHDFANNYDEESEQITWFGKPNTHSKQPIFQKLLNGNLTPHFFARWDNKHLNFKYIGIGKVLECEDGVPMPDGSGRTVIKLILKAETKSQSSNTETFFDSEIDVAGSNVEDAHSEIEDHDSLETETKTSGRKEQGMLRELHLKNKNTGTCSICGSELPANLLVAAHIKKRAECSLKEKKDFHNIATLMCLLGCDALFENGYIGVKEGKIVSLRTGSTVNAQSHASMLLGADCKDWKDGNKDYYDWHFDFHSSPEL